MIEHDNQLSLSRQCFLLGVPRSSYYYRGQPQLLQEDEMLMQVIDRIYTEEPAFGNRRMVDELRTLGYKVGRDKVRSLMRAMGMEAIYPKPRTTQPGKGHKKYPYLLRGLEIDTPNQVWCSDITYIPLGNGHVYLTVVMDWASRYILSWKLSNSLDESFCVECLKEALETGAKPGIFNTDQGRQYTGNSFTGILQNHGIKISMDGRGRALDNVMVERFWRTIKYDDIYIRCYETMPELYHGIEAFIAKYNRRKHQTLGMSPEEKYFWPSQEKAA